MQWQRIAVVKYRFHGVWPRGVWGMGGVLKGYPTINISLKGKKTGQSLFLHEKYNFWSCFGNILGPLEIFTKLKRNAANFFNTSQKNNFP